MNHSSAVFAIVRQLCSTKQRLLAALLLTLFGCLAWSGSALAQDESFASALADVESSTPKTTFLDPVPNLLNGAQVTTDYETLASKGRTVSGVSADSATQMVLRITAASVGEQFTITVINDQGQQSTS